MQVRGSLMTGSGLIVPPDASAPVSVSLHLETHFGSVHVPLIKQQHEQDAASLNQQITSGEVEHILLRAVMWAAACLASSEPQTQQAGETMLSTIDSLERCVAPHFDNKLKHTCALSECCHCTELWLP